MYRRQALHVAEAGHPRTGPVLLSLHLAVGTYPPFIGGLGTTHSGTSTALMISELAHARERLTAVKTLLISSGVWGEFALKKTVLFEGQPQAYAPAQGVMVQPRHISRHAPAGGGAG